MKKRRLALAAFLICAILVVGVGYAATSTTLNINGSATTSSTDIAIYFSSGTITQQASGGTATPGDLSGKPKSVTFTASGLKTAGEKIIATYTIQNDSDYSVEITPTVTNNDQTNFTVTTDFTTPKTLTPKSATEETDSYTFTVTVELKNTPNTVAGLSADFNITIHANGK